MSIVCIKEYLVISSSGKFNIFMLFFPSETIIIFLFIIHILLMPSSCSYIFIFNFKFLLLLSSVSLELISYIFKSPVVVPAIK